MTVSPANPLEQNVRIQPSGCWEWQGWTNDQGYGYITLDGRSVRAHRHFYEKHVGPIPKDMVLDHLCRNRVCVNPKHLEQVTSRENTLRGIGPAARRAAQTHCVSGHEFTTTNTHIRPNGTRRCRECDRLQKKRNRA